MTRVAIPGGVGQRRSLTHVGGDVELGGDEEAAELLAEALRVPSAESQEEDGEDAARAHIHGFHTYPARMHPLTASRLVHAFASPRARVLDPFCGSGTVLVEAMLAGRDAVGSDLNPLAVRLSRLKTSVTTEAEREELLAAARKIASFADERRKTKAGATRRYPQDDVLLFDPHVLLELDSLRAGIALVKDPRVSHPLSLVLSALLVKVSRKQSDTSSAVEKRRIAAGYTAKLFTRKTEELTRLLAELAGALPKPTPRVRVEIDDACELASVKTGSIHAVISSPPYAATYDYMAHHAMRLRWLGLEGKATTSFAEKEMGSRRRYAELDAASALAEWQHELEGFLLQMARVLVKDAPLVLLMADSAVGNVALRADAIVAEVAGWAGLEPYARASQRRPNFHPGSAAAFRETPRAEHALLLLRS